LKQNPYLPADIAAARATLAQAQVALQNSLTNLDGASIVAPYDGLISAVNMNVNENSLSGVTGGGTGSSGSNSSNGITVLNPSSLLIYVQVDESDISQVVVGQTANMTFDGIPGRRFRGSVSSVSPGSTTTQGVVGYQVGIQMEDASAVRQGMTATAQIVTAEQADVLMVPNRALSQVPNQGSGRQGGASGEGARAQGGNREGGAATFQGRGGQGQEGRARVQQRQVQVQTENGPETRVVEIGMANDTNTAVLSGLEEGDVVLLPATAARAGLPGQRPGNATFVSPLGGGSAGPRR
jgi:hypothetical protein